MHWLRLARFAWRHTGWPGVVAGLASAAVLGWRGQRELARPLAPINAPSHWFHGERALRADGPSLRYTGVGMLTHQASSLFWGLLYDLLRRRRRRPTAANAVGDAVAVTVVAAVVDLAVVPERLTPGFEHRLSGRGLGWVYAGFAVGLALGGLMTLRDR